MCDAGNWNFRPGEADCHSTVCPDYEFYNRAIYECDDCTQNCIACGSSNLCVLCGDGFILDIANDRTCRPKAFPEECNPGYIWNAQAAECQVGTPDFTLSAEETSLLRCQAAVFKAENVVGVDFQTITPEWVFTVSE